MRLFNLDTKSKILSLNRDKFVVPVSLRGGNRNSLDTEKSVCPLNYINRGTVECVKEGS